MRRAPRDVRRRARARVGVSLPRVPTANRQPVRPAVAVARRARDDHRPIDDVRARRRRRHAHRVPLFPTCGATVYYELDAMPGMIAVPVGAFADPAFPPPTWSIYDARKHGWVVMPEGTSHMD